MCDDSEWEVERIQTSKWSLKVVVRADVINLLHHFPEDLLQRNEARRVGGSNTRTSVSDRAVGDGELSEVVANHLSLDVHNVEDLAVVDSNSRTNHLRDDDHVAEVSLDDSRLLKRTSLYDDKDKSSSHETKTREKRR